MAKKPVFPKISKATPKAVETFGKLEKCKVWEGDWQGPGGRGEKPCNADDITDMHYAKFDDLQGFMSSDHTYMLLDGANKKNLKHGILYSGKPWVPLKCETLPSDKDMRKVEPLYQCWQPGRSKKRRSCVSIDNLIKVKKMLRHNSSAVCPVISAKGDRPVFFFNTVGEAVVVSPLTMTPGGD